MKKNVITFFLGLALCSCQKSYDRYEKKGVELLFNVSYNKKEDKTGSNIIINEAGIQYSGYSEYYVSKPLIKHHDVSINGTRFSNEANSYNVDDSGFVVSTVFLYKENGNSYANTFTVDTIDFFPSDTLDISTKDSIYWIGKPLFNEQVILHVNGRQLGSTSQNGSNGMKTDRFLRGYMNRFIELQLTRIRYIPNYELSLPNDRGGATLSYTVYKTLYIKAS